MSFVTSNLRHNFILIGLIAFVGGSVFFYRSLAKEVDTPSSALAENNPFTGSDQFVQGEYKNGSYNATGGYVSPSGPEQIEIALILRNDVIEDIQITKLAQSPTSVFFQEKFETGYKNLVVGKNINEVMLDKVAGSSLTPIGFNEALEKIKAQAKS